MNLRASIFRLIFAGRVKRLGGIPGPIPTFPLGTAGELKDKNRQAWEVCADYADLYGPVTLIWILGSPAIVLNEPDLIGEVLEDMTGRFYKKDPCQAWVPTLTRGSMFVQNPPAWQGARAYHPFSKDWIPRWLEQQTETMEAAVARWADSRRGTGTFALLPEMMRLAADIAALTIVGRPLDDDAYADQAAIFAKANARTLSPLSFLPPLSPRFYAHKRRWYRWFRQRIEILAATNDDQATDLVSACRRQGYDLNKGSFAPMIANIVQGGMFSMTSAIITALYQMSQDPRILWDLKQQVRGSLRPAKPGGRKLLDQVILEAMRFHPPVPLYFRNTSPDRSVELCGHSLPPDTMIFITNYYLQKRSAHWEHPETFDPSRWADPKSSDPVGGRFFFPFGRGPRACVGQGFAELYMRTTLASLLRHVDVEMDPSQPYLQSLFFGTMMPCGLTARFEAILDREDPATAPSTARRPRRKARGRADRAQGA